MQNEKASLSNRLIPKLALWLTLGAATWLGITYTVILGVLHMYETVTTFPIWLAGIAASLGLILSIAKIVTSRTWKSRLVGVLFILINLTVIAMSAFSITLSFVRILGG